MSVLGYIIVFSLIGSVISLIGGMLLLFKEKFARKVSHLLSSFAAGALLGTAFLDLLPEAIHESGGEAGIIVWVLVGMLVFFILERFIHFFHHHHEHAVTDKPVVALLMTGDSIHNFIDGVVIAATFMVSIPLGVVTTLAVAAHEIPQEIGDFAILLDRGWSKAKIVVANVFSSLASVAGALIGYFAAGFFEGQLSYLLAAVAGIFTYIAASDLIPEIHHRAGHERVAGVL